MFFFFFKNNLFLEIFFQFILPKNCNQKTQFGRGKKKKKKKKSCCEPSPKHKNLTNTTYFQIQQTKRFLLHQKNIYSFFFFFLFSCSIWINGGRHHDHGDGDRGRDDVRPTYWFHNQRHE